MPIVKVNPSHSEISPHRSMASHGAPGRGRSKALICVTDLALRRSARRETERSAGGNPSEL